MSKLTVSDKDITFVLQESKPESYLGKLERIFKILSYITLPVLIAYGGWSIQKSISTSEINQQYVSLAISILSDEKADEDDKIMRGWAVDILVKHSPIEISIADKYALLEGTKVISLGNMFIITERLEEQGIDMEMIYEKVPLGKKPIDE